MSQGDPQGDDNGGVVPNPLNGVEAVPASREREAIVVQALQAAYAALKDGKLSEALQLSEAVQRFAPDLLQTHALRARVLRATGSIEAADRAESEAIRLMALRLYALDPRPGLGERMVQFSKVTFLGGPPATFVQLGQMQLLFLIEQGLESQHRVLDIGCGALRAGLWLMRVVEPGHYCGIEPHCARLAFGIEHVVGADLMARKRPRFDHNTDFDLSVFGCDFDFMVARSVWTHASKPQILAMLDGFEANATPAGVFLTSFLPSSSPETDYGGADWVGRSESSPFGGLITHDLGWIQASCAERGLRVRASRDHVVNGQIWLRIERAAPAA